MDDRDDFKELPSQENMKVDSTQGAHPKVSVVIPTYNHAKLIRLALESVRSQSFTDWEAIVVNNFSEDDTEAVVTAFGDSRIRLVNFRNHGVIAASRNEGVRRARGEWIAFLDSDDVWAPTKLEKCLAVATKEIDLVCHSESVVRNGRVEWVNHYGPEERATFDALLFERNCISTSAVVVRKTLVDSLGGFREDPALVTSEDYDLWIRIAGAGARMKFLRQVLGEYLLHESNQSQAVERHLKAVREVVLRNFASIEKPSFRERIRLRRRLAYAVYYAGRNFGEQGAFGKSLSRLGSSVAEYPFSLRPYLAAILVMAQAVRNLAGVRTSGGLLWRPRT